MTQTLRAKLDRCTVCLRPAVAVYVQVYDDGEVRVGACCYSDPHVLAAPGTQPQERKKI